jgi:hypothetical protein
MPSFSSIVVQQQSQPSQAGLRCMIVEGLKTD